MKDFLSKSAYLIAALLLLAGIAYFIFSKPNGPQALDSRHFQPESEKLAGIMNDIGSFGFAGEPQNREDSLALALDLYGKTKYEEAQKLLETYLRTYPDDRVALFYLGMTHLYLHAPEKAFGILSPLSELHDFNMQDDASWYAALAASNVDKKQAKELFANLSQDPSSKYREAANAVLSSISENTDDFSFQAGTKSSFLVDSRPAWWQSGWMRVLAAIFFPLGSVGMIFWRKRREKLAKQRMAKG
jgi:tetratricopeptide (TPR) repeat protein